MFNESAIVKYGGDIISLSRGQPAHVEFDFEKVWNFKRSLGKAFIPHLLSFYHVHPPGFLMYSSLDVECLKGFNIAFGYPVFFGIITFDTTSFNDVKYQDIAFKFQDNAMVEIPVDGRLSMWDALILKGASYAAEVT